MSLVRSIIQFFHDLLTTPLRIGGISVSINSILTTLIALSLVVLFSRYLSNWIRDQLLVKLGVQEGTREAISTILRYFAIALAVIVVPQMAGVDMRSISFLAGGLGIGIGFGFQGLAQNFVSGLILLLERPVQVGDYIELGDLEGTIRKISIRSTVLVTNDGISIIIPNSDLIDNRIINWSYGDIKSRIHIPVPVDHSSDPVLVTEALLASARQEPRVLMRPAPQVWLSHFGEDAINYELLVWIDQPGLDCQFAAP